MVNRFDETGCWVDEGEFVTYVNYRELEVADDVFQKKVNRVLKDLSATPELPIGTGADTAAQDLDDAINDAIGQLEKAFSERKD